MHLRTNSLLLLLLSLLLLVVSPASARVSTTCIKVVTALIGRPTQLFELFQREICDRGCQPTVPHWDLWTRNNTFVPAVRSMTKRLDGPAEEQAMIRMGDEAAEVIKARCGPILAGKKGGKQGHICADGETLAEFGNCFKKHFFRSALANLPDLLRMVSEPVCEEQYEYVKGDVLWEEIIPANMREYAAECHSLGEKGEKQQQEEKEEEKEEDRKDEL